MRLLFLTLLAAAVAAGCGSTAGDDSPVAATPAPSIDGSETSIEALEEEFAQTPFGGAVDELPLRKPPLHVQQFVLEGDSHDLVVRVAPRRFLCDLSAEQRVTAVRAYFTAAERVMRDAGVRDFRLTVDAVRDTGEVRPLARASERGVHLTARGRDTRSC